MSKQRRVAEVMAGVLLVTAMAGCRSEYSVAIRNSGSEEISEAQLSGEGLRYVAGYVLPATAKTRGGIPGQIPGSVVLEWKSAEGGRHRVEVAVPESVPRDFDGDVVFEINDKHEVSVTTKANLNLGSVRRRS